MFWVFKDAVVARAAKVVCYRPLWVQNKENANNTEMLTYEIKLVI